MRFPVIRAVLLLPLVLIACGRSSTPLLPSDTRPASRSASAFGVLVALPESMTVGDSVLARCLAGSGDASCFTASNVAKAARVTFDLTASTNVHAAGAIGGADVVTPDPPTNLTANVFRVPNSSASNVSFFWRAPLLGPAPTNYIIDVGSAPGLSDIASFFSGSARTIFSTTVSGSGTFFVRVRSFNGATSAPSNEIRVTLLESNVPGPPLGLRAAVTGDTVTLAWFAPTAGSPPTSYVIQASSQPGGPPNLANITTGNTLTTAIATSVPPGTYFVRILAANDAGVGVPSNEVSLIVLGSLPCVGAPTPPTNLVALINGSTVTLGWTISTGQATSYVVEAGSAPGATDIGVFDTGSSAGGATFAGVPPGTFFVRVRAKNTCGTSGQSNEVTAVVR
jgi:fibronectin type III domain protein